LNVLAIRFLIEQGFFRRRSRIYHQEYPRVDFDEYIIQQQAKAFYRGDQVPGIPGLTGGSRVPIDENTTDVNYSTILRARKDQRQLEESGMNSLNRAYNASFELPGTQTPGKQVPQATQNITFNQNFYNSGTSEDTVKQNAKQMAEAIKDKSSPVYLALSELIWGIDDRRDGFA